MMMMTMVVMKMIDDKSHTAVQCSIGATSNCDCGWQRSHKQTGDKTKKEEQAAELHRAAASTTGGDTENNGSDEDDRWQVTHCSLVLNRSCQ